MARDQSFERFVRGCSSGLFRTAVLIAGDREVAEDLLQATLMRVARRWADASRSPEAYAHRVLVNLSRDRYRRARRRVAESPWTERTADPLQLDHADAVAARSVVIAALGRLPPRQREVLVLRFYADLSVADTAAATGASEGTVKSYTSRALARMRELLGEPTTPEVSHERR